MNKTKRMTGVLLGLLIVFALGFGGTILLNSQTQNTSACALSLPPDGKIIEKDSEISNLTWQDLEHIFSLAEVFMNENPRATEDEIDGFIKNEMIGLSSEKQNVSTPDYVTGGAVLPAAFLALTFSLAFAAIDVFNDAMLARSRTDYFYVVCPIEHEHWQTNGDAFRHAYWNALMVRSVGAFTADLFATAYESGTNSSGIDKQMDLINNDRGREDGKAFSNLTKDQLAYRIMTHVSHGHYVRIKNNKLVKTCTELLKQEFVNPNQWHQPIWTSSSNTHGTITSGNNHVSGRDPWGAFDGWIGGVTDGNNAGYPAAQWSRQAASGWIQLSLNYDIVVHSISFYNRHASLGGRTKGAYFTGSHGVALGSPFTAHNSDSGRTIINVGGVRTGLIRLNVTSTHASWIEANYIGASEIIIHATLAHAWAPTVGDNLLDPSMYEMGDSVGTAGQTFAWSKTYNGFSGARVRVSQLVPVVPGRNYRAAAPQGYQIAFAFRNANTVSVWDAGWRSIRAGATAPSNATSMSVVFRKYGDAQISVAEIQSLSFEIFELCNHHLLNPLLYEVGDLWGTTGQTYAWALSQSHAAPGTRVRVNALLPVTAGRTYTLVAPAGYQIAIAFRNSSTVSVLDSGWRSGTSTITAPSNAVTISVVFCKQGNAQITLDEIQALPFQIVAVF
jgi:hypothetical protein